MHVAHNCWIWINNNMKINEIIKSRKQIMLEQLHENNSTGFLTEDLVRVVEATEHAQWSKPCTADEILQEMQQWQKK